MRLDLALIRRHPGLSRRRAREVIEKGQVRVEGRTVLDPGQPVGQDGDVDWDPNRKALRRIRSSLPILYEDDTLLVVDKPAGLLTVRTRPGAVGEDTALARVADYVRRLHPRRAYVGVVHRLDRDTSGALAFALSPVARQGLRALFRAHRIERRYAAVVQGEPELPEAVVSAPIHDSYQAGRRRVARPGESSHAALTRYRVVERLDGAALLEVDLETGRQHQIRLHLAHVGLPILGDTLYRPESAGRAPVWPRRQMLHARVLGLTHPLTGKAVRVESPLPEDFLQTLGALRRRAAPRDPGGRPSGSGPRHPRRR